MPHSLYRMLDLLERHKRGEGTLLPARTSKILREGKEKMAKKLIEEAGEVALDAVLNNRQAVIEESADLLYHLTLIWSTFDLSAHEIWQELERREALYGLPEKLSKQEPRSNQEELF